MRCVRLGRTCGTWAAKRRKRHEVRQVAQDMWVSRRSAVKNCVYYSHLLGFRFGSEELYVVYDGARTCGTWVAKGRKNDMTCASLGPEGAQQDFACSTVISSWNIWDTDLGRRSCLSYRVERHGCTHGRCIPLPTPARHSHRPAALMPCLATPCFLILYACTCIRLILPTSRTASATHTPHVPLEQSTRHLPVSPPASGTPLRCRSWRRRICTACHPTSAPREAASRRVRPPPQPHQVPVERSALHLCLP